jgi:hypothetical protein
VDRAAVPLDDLAANGEADAGPLVFVPAVQSLEQLENPLLVLLIEADAVVGDDKPPTGPARQRRRIGGIGNAAQGRRLDRDVRRLARLGELEGVSDQILKELPELEWVGGDRRQVRCVDACGRLRKPFLEVAENAGWRRART